MILWGFRLWRLVVFVWIFMLVSVGMESLRYCWLSFWGGFWFFLVWLIVG